MNVFTSTLFLSLAIGFHYVQSSSEGESSRVLKSTQQDLYAEKRWNHYNYEKTLSAPEDFRVNFVTTKMVSLSWTKPLDWNGAGDGYQLEFYQNIVDLRIAEESYIAIGLVPWTYYPFTVAGFTINENKERVIGEKAKVNATTVMAEPGKPRNLHAPHGTSDSVVIAWDSPYDPNGPVTGYVLGNGFENITVEQENEYTFKGLIPWTNYIYSVYAYNENNGVQLVGPAETITVKTEVGKPSLCRNFRSEQTSTNSTVLYWDPPTTANGPLDGYRVTQTSEGSNPITLNTLSRSPRVVNLKPYTRYNFTVTAYNKFIHSQGSINSDPVTIQTMTSFSEPSIPLSLIITSTTSNSVGLSWKPPAVPNGPISGYIVYFDNVGEMFEQDTKQTDYVFKGLAPWTEYTFYVSAYNGAPESRLEGKSASITARTDFSEPSVPLSLVITSTTSNSVGLSWEPPADPNGPISGYIVYFDNVGEMFEQDTKQTDYVFKGLSPWTEYTFYVSAYNGAPESRLEGKSASITAKTDSSAPSEPASLTVVSVTQDTILVTWTPPLNPNGPVSGYYLILMSEGSTYEEATMEKQYLFQDLKPWTKYNITIQAYNPNNAIGPAIWTSVTTRPAVPGPVLNAHVGTRTRFSIQVLWERPKYPIRPVTGYIVSHTSDEIVYEDVVQETMFTVDSLQPWSEYSITICAFNEDNGKKLKGPSTTLTAQTLYSAPSAPTWLTITSTTSDSIGISWKRPDIPNGPISGYTVHCRGEMSEQDTKQTEYVFRGLSPWTEYTLSVAAYNEDETRWEGAGASIVGMTNYSEPSRPESLSVFYVSEKEIFISWKPPSEPNGPIDGYNVFLRSKGSLFDATTTERRYMFEDLKPWTNYKVSVLAYNPNNTVGPAVSTDVRTRASVPPVPDKSLQVTANENSLVLRVPVSLFSDDLGPIVAYALLVAEISSPDKSPRDGREKFNSTAFLSWKDVKDSTAWYKASPDNWNLTLDDSICKTKNNETRECMIGSEKHCPESEKYCNGPLKSQRDYSVKIRGYTETGWSETLPITTTTSVAARSSSLTTGLVIFLCICILNVKSSILTTE